MKRWWFGLGFVVACGPQSAPRVARRSATSESRAPASPTDATEALLQRAHAALLDGKVDDAQRLQEQAAARLKEATGQHLSLLLPSTGRGAYVSWQGASEWVFALSADGISLRQRDEWYPRFYSPRFTDDGGADRNHVLSPDGKTLLWRHKIEDATYPAGSGVWLSVVRVTPGPEFGRELARYRVYYAPPPLWLPDSSKFLIPEQTGQYAAVALAVVSSATGQVERRIDAQAIGNFAGIALGAGGKHLVITRPSSGVSFIDLTTGKEYHDPKALVQVNIDRLSPDERYTLWRGVGTDTAVNTAVIYDAKEHRTRSLSVGKCLPDEYIVFDETSRFVALGSREPVVCVLDLATGQVREFQLGEGRGYGFVGAFFESGTRLLAYFGGAGIFIDTKTGKTLGSVASVRQLTRINEQPTLVSIWGTLTRIDHELTLRSVNMDTRLEGTVGRVRPLGLDVALQFNNGWAIVNATTGKTRVVAGIIDDLTKSPDEAFLASGSRQVEIIDAQSAKPVARSPLTLAEHVELTTPGDGLVRVSTHTRAVGISASGDLAISDTPYAGSDNCSGQPLRDPTGRYGWDEVGEQEYDPDKKALPEHVPAQIDCATGKRGKVRHFKGYPEALINKDHLVVVDEEHGLTLWDVDSGRPMARLPAVQYVGSNFIVGSPDDRLLLIGRRLWDLSRGVHVLELPDEPEGARFYDSHTLLTTQRGRVTVRGGADFQELATLFFARDLSAAIVVTKEAPGGDPKLEVFGPEDAWDSTFTCGVQGRGVPFRVCRKAFAQPGLLASLLTPSTTGPTPCLKLPADLVPVPESSPNPTLAGVRAAAGRYVVGPEPRESSDVIPSDAEYFIADKGSEWLVTIAVRHCWDSLAGIHGGGWLRDVRIRKKSLELVEVTGPN